MLRSVLRTLGPPDGSRRKKQQGLNATKRFFEKKLEK
jgi:hypothetical protein